MASLVATCSEEGRLRRQSTHQALRTRPQVMTKGRATTSEAANQNRAN